MGPELCLNIKTIFVGMGIPMLKVRCSWECLIFDMGIFILVRQTSLYWDSHLILSLIHPSWPSMSGEVPHSVLYIYPHDIVTIHIVLFSSPHIVNTTLMSFFAKPTPCIVYLHKHPHVSTQCSFVIVSLTNFMFCISGKLMEGYLMKAWDRGTISNNVYWLIIQIFKKNVLLLQKIMIRSGHNFAHVTTAKLSWHVQNCDLTGSLEWR